MKSIRFSFLLCVIVLEIACETPKMATPNCEQEHNQLSSKIDFMANCKRTGKTDSDSEDKGEHECYMMKRYCAKECSENAYDTGKCDVKSIFTLNLNVNAKGNYETLDCVCIYNTPKIGCYSTYHIPWQTVTQEFDKKCASNEDVKTTTKTPATKEKTTVKTSAGRGPKILLIGGMDPDPDPDYTVLRSMEYFYPDQPAKNKELDTSLFSPIYGGSFLLNDSKILSVGTDNHVGVSVFVDTVKWRVDRAPATKVVRHEAGYAALAGVPYACGGNKPLKNSEMETLSSCEKFEDGSWKSASSLITYAANANIT